MRIRIWWAQLQGSRLKRWQPRRLFVLFGVSLLVASASMVVVSPPSAYAAPDDCADPVKRSECSLADRNACQSGQGNGLKLCTVEQAAQAKCDQGTDQQKQLCQAVRKKIADFTCVETGNQKELEGCKKNKQDAANGAGAGASSDQSCGTGLSDSGGGGVFGGNSSQQNAASGSSGAAENSACKDPKLACDLSFDFATIFSLKWLICPVVDKAMEAAGLFENVINSLLNIDVAVVFDNNNSPGTTATGTTPTQPGTPQSQQAAASTGNSYHKAWNSFRIIAISIVIVAALVMILAQAAGLELLDAYTIRKVLPRLLFATIFIAISWDVLEFLIQLSNDAGKGVRYLIYAPFAALDTGKQVISGGSSTALALIGTGAAVAFGWVGLLLFVLSGLTAALVAVATLILREMIIILLVMLAPFALACYILPNTQKLWEFWRKTFLSLLIVFPLISGFIAIGRVFAITSLNASGDQTINQLIAIISYFAPYFMIPAAFRMAGGVLAQVNGILNKAASPVQGMLKQARANNMKSRAQKMKQGKLLMGAQRNPDGTLKKSSLLNPYRLFGEGVNQAGLQASLGQAGLGQLARGNVAGFARVRGSARQFQLDQAARAIKNDPKFASFANDEEALLAAMTNGGTLGERTALLSKFLQDQRGMEKSDADKTAREGAQRADAMGYGAGVSRAAFRAALEDGTVVRDEFEQGNLMAMTAGGSKETEAALSGEAHFINKKVGRNDLAQGAGGIAKETRLYAEGRMKGKQATGDADKKAEAEAIFKQGVETAHATMSGYTAAQLKEKGNKNYLKQIEKRMAGAQSGMAAAQRSGNGKAMQAALEEAVLAGAHLASTQSNEMYMAAGNKAEIEKAVKGVGGYKLGQQLSWAQNTAYPSRNASTPGQRVTVYSEAQKRGAMGGRMGRDLNAENIINPPE